VESYWPFVRATSRCCTLKVHVASVCFKCFRRIIGMLQLFHADVAKVNRDVAYVATIVHYVASFYSQYFIFFFAEHIASVFIFICFSHMFQVFYLGVVYGLQWFSSVFLVVFC
jgi:hypothetical protein